MTKTYDISNEDELAQVGHQTARVEVALRLLIVMLNERQTIDNAAANMLVETLADPRGPHDAAYFNRHWADAPTHWSNEP
jgi:hypothetical protein